MAELKHGRSGGKPKNLLRVKGSEWWYIVLNNPFFFFQCHIVNSYSLISNPNFLFFSESNLKYPI